MTDADKKTLIAELRYAAGCEDAHLSNADHEIVDMQLRAATAIEGTLWHQIDDMPEELKDGREFFTSHPVAGVGVASWGQNISFMATHYMEITPPQGGPIMSLKKVVGVKK